MGTGTLFLRESWDARKRIVNLKGNMTNPMDGNSIVTRQRIVFVDKDNFLIENFDTYKGKKRKRVFSTDFYVNNIITSNQGESK